MGYRQGHIGSNFSREVLVESCRPGFINDSPFHCQTCPGLDDNHPKLQTFIDRCDNVGPGGLRLWKRLVLNWALKNS